ncbi:uncharacterized protein DFL_008325 [Arthrobotrys flagrans]|uniref:Amidohydrolase 3 domain-containing protein n=1 Tax=Arthrobotrys flagrans TaxID=97331 RepID=A0A436ZNF2_ARTFL|nr:hypothetical protein DFL_008325 [Arthrobotrys flagrans]
MRFFHKLPAGPLVLAGFVFSLLSPSIAHPDHEKEAESCLTGHIKLAEIIFGKISPSDFDTEAVSRRFSLLEKRTSDQNVPIIFYSSSQQNRRPIITMANDRLSPVEALAIHDGRVIGVGSLATVRKLAGERRVFHNLHKQVILPGFVEPHLHVMLSALLKGYFLDISPLRAPGFEVATERLREELKTLNPGEWLIAYGYDPSRLNWHDLSKEDLDKEVSSTTPIIVINASGHLAYANSLAFQEVGITKDTPNPEGGEYAKDPKTGELTGVLVESGAILQFSRKATLANLGRTGRVKEGLAKILGQWLAKGLTTVFDGGLGAVTPQDLETVANLTEVSPIRIRAAVADLKPGDAEKTLGTGNMPPGGFKQKGLVVKTIKLWSDGSTQGFTAAVKQNYLSEHFPAYFEGKKKGVLVWPDSANSGESAFNTTMYDEMLKWLNRGYQLMIHANGDRASDIVLGNFEKIFKKYPKHDPKRSGIIHRIEHFTVTKTPQVQKAKDLGIAVSHTMGHVHYWGDAFKFGVLGKERAERIDPVKDGVKTGAIYSFNSDSPVTDADPLLWVGTAISRRVYKSNTVLGKAQRVGLEDALKGVTSYPAKQILWDKEVGSLEPGKFADFVIVNRDLRCFDWEQKSTDEIKILETWIGGVRRYSALGSL